VTKELIRQADTGAKAHIRALDGIRGVAVLAVLFYHFGDLSQSTSALLRLVGIVKGAGWMGVDMFFALSGFLITDILCKTQHKPNAAVNFYARRTLRLFPLFYGVWACIGLYMWLTHLPWHSGYWMYLLYAGNFIAVKYGSVGILVVSHFWSLAVEEQYYLIWPFVVWKLQGARKVGSILLGALLLSFLLKLILMAKHANPSLAYFMLPTHIESIAMGSFVAIALRRNIKEPIVAWSRILLPLSAASIVLLGLIEHGLNNLNPVVQLCFPLFGLFACCLIVRSLDQASLTARIMTNSILRFYGRYSYGLYVYSALFHHSLKLYLYQTIIKHVNNQLILNFGYLFVCYLILTLISVVSFHLYESQFLKLKRKFDSVPAARPARSHPSFETSVNQVASEEVVCLQLDEHY
jgi:peptidoglycan/LPS O-acetylase OafA/YrhL